MLNDRFVPTIANKRTLINFINRAFFDIVYELDDGWWFDLLLNLFFIIFFQADPMSPFGSLSCVSSCMVI